MSFQCDDDSVTAFVKAHRALSVEGGRECSVQGETITPPQSRLYGTLPRTASFSSRMRNINFSGGVVDFRQVGKSQRAATTGHFMDLVGAGADTASLGASTLGPMPASQPSFAKISSRFSSVYGSGANASTSGGELSQWELYNYCESFAVHTKLSPRHYEKDADDCSATLTIVLHSSHAQHHDAEHMDQHIQMRSHDVDKLMVGEESVPGKNHLRGDSSSGTSARCHYEDHSVREILTHVHSTLPCRLVHVTCVYVFPSILCHVYSTLRHQIRSIIHCQVLLTTLLSFDVDSSPQDDVSSPVAILRYVAAVLTSLVVCNTYGENQLPSTHQVAALIAGEGERRQILWQHQRRLIKREMVSRKFRSNLKAVSIPNDGAEGGANDARGSGSGTTTEPSPSDELIVKLVDKIIERYGDENVDVNTLEGEFTNIIDRSEESFLAAMGITLPQQALQTACNDDKQDRCDGSEGAQQQECSVFERVKALQEGAEGGIIELLALFRKACAYATDKKVSVPVRGEHVTTFHDIVTCFV